MEEVLKERETVSPKRRREKLTRPPLEYWTAIRRAAGFAEAALAISCLAADCPHSALFLAGLGALINIDAFLKVMLPKEIDLTAKHLPGLAIPVLDRLTPARRRREALLTPERRKLAEAVVANICRRTAPYGVKPFKFAPWHLKVVFDRGPKTAGTANYLSGRITLETRDILSDSHFVGILAHEYYETLVVRRWSRRPGRHRLRFEFPSLGRWGLDWLAEGIIEKSTQITALELGFSPYMAYRERIAIIDHLLEAMARERRGRGELVSPSELFPLFEEALYGRGNLKPLFTQLQETYENQGGIKKLWWLVETVGQKQGELEKKDLEPGEEARLRAAFDMAYENLVEFTRLPAAPTVTLTPLRLAFLIKQSLGGPLEVTKDCSQTWSPVRIRDSLHPDFKTDLTSGQKLFFSPSRAMTRFTIRETGDFGLLEKVAEFLNNLGVAVEEAPTAIEVWRQFLPKSLSSNPKTRQVLGVEI